MREPGGLVWWGLNTDSGWKGANKQEKLREFNLFLEKNLSVGFVFWHTEASGVLKRSDNIIYLVKESHVDLFGEF